MSTLTLPSATAALATAAPGAAPGLLQRLLAARARRAEDQIRPFLGRQKRRALGGPGRRRDRRPAPGQVAAAKPQGDVHLSLKKPRKETLPLSTVLSGLIAPAQTGQGRARTGLAWALAASLEVPQRLLAYAAERRRIARTVAQLQGLSDRMLADIGLQRCDIARVARYGRDTDVRSFLGAMR